MFVDAVDVRVRAGKGGDGATSFRREKYVAKGGPDGGDGGKGGDVVVRAETNTHTLSGFRHEKTLSAENGEAGKTKRGRGKSGEDLEVNVPVGTIIYEGDSVVADLDEPGQTALIGKGGGGGFGNAHFTSSTRQAPRMAELGESGEEKTLRFELKTVADIGLVGLPNAGKSTLLSVMSNAKPAIADYAFTTLEPNLGVVDVHGTALVFADIPGLINGASDGKGLGDAFLRHIERTKTLLYLIDSLSEDVVSDYRTLRQELSSYAIDVASKPHLVALTRIDAIDEDTLAAQMELLGEAGVENVYPVSSVAHKGLDALLTETLELPRSTPEDQEEDGEPDDIPTITLGDDPDAWWVEQISGQYVVHGEKIGRFAERTDFSNQEAVQRFRDILRKKGIDRELERFGVERGDTILVGGKTFQW
jgi:GTP-binding protein